MLNCIACSKPLVDGGEEELARGTPRTRDAIKSLSSQIKDMVLKLSGSHRQGKPYTASVAPGGADKMGGFSGRSFDGEFDAVSGVGEDQGGRRHHLRTGCSSSSTPGWDFTGFDEVLVEDDGATKEWVAQVEPGVHITFFSTPGGGNDLKRIRFSREMFSKWQAQRWWGENYDRILELYNVQRFSRSALPTPLRPDYEGEAPATPRPGRARWARVAHGGGVLLPVPDPTEHILPYNPSFPVKRESDGPPEPGPGPVEWVAQDEPGVYITVRQLPDGSRELRRVRFSREQFAEKNAKRWWEMNQERILAQYL